MEGRGGGGGGVAREGGGGGEGGGGSMAVGGAGGGGGGRMEGRQQVVVVAFRIVTHLPDRPLTTYSGHIHGLRSTPAAKQGSCTCVISGRYGDAKVSTAASIRHPSPYRLRQTDGNATVATASAYVGKFRGTLCARQVFDGVTSSL